MMLSKPSVSVTAFPNRVLQMFMHILKWQPYSQSVLSCDIWTPSLARFRRRAISDYIKRVYI